MRMSAYDAPAALAEASAASARFFRSAAGAARSAETGRSVGHGSQGDHRLHEFTSVDHEDLAESPILDRTECQGRLSVATDGTKRGTVAGVCGGARRASTTMPASTRLAGIAEAVVGLDDRAPRRTAANQGIAGPAVMDTRYPDSSVQAIRLTAWDARAGSTRSRSAYSDGAPIAWLSGPTLKMADRTLGLRSGAGSAGLFRASRSTWK